MIKIKQLQAFAQEYGLTLTSKVHPRYIRIWNLIVTDTYHNTMVLEWSFNTSKQHPNGSIDCRIYPAIANKPTKNRPIKFTKYSRDHQDICERWLLLFAHSHKAIYQIAAFNLPN